MESNHRMWFFRPPRRPRTPSNHMVAHLGTAPSEPIGKSFTDSTASLTEYCAISGIRWSNRNFISGLEDQCSLRWTNRTYMVEMRGYAPPTLVCKTRIFLIKLHPHKWCAMVGSNHRPSACKADARPCWANHAYGRQTETWTQNLSVISRVRQPIAPSVDMVGYFRFELKLYRVWAYFLCLLG